MSENELYEALGRKTAALEALQAVYAKLLQVMAHVAAGDITPERITVDVLTRSWSVTAITPVASVATERNGDLLAARRKKG